MRNTHFYLRLPLVFITAVISSGCAAINYELQQRIAAEASSLPLDVENDEAVEQAAAKVLSGDVDQIADFSLPASPQLGDYVALALQRNPAIQKQIRKLQMFGFRVPQVTSLEDPMINLIPPTGDMTETAAGMMDGSVGVSQKLPFPGKLSGRGRVAEQDVLVGLAELTDVRIRTVSDVVRAYYDYFLADISTEITKESQLLLEQIRDVASARYQTGAATQQDVLRAEVELYSLTNDLITLSQQRLTAQAKLNTLMSRPVQAPLPPPKAIELESVEWRLPEILDRAVQTNPKLLAIKEQVRRDLEAVKLARLEYYPDLRLGFSFTFIGSGISPVATGDDNWNLPLGFNLPIWWQRIRAQVLESNAKTLSSVEQFEELRNAIFFGLQDTLVKIDTQYRQAVLFRDAIVPRARQAVDVSTANYQAGELEFTALVENWENWLKFSLAYYRSLAELEQRFADLEQLVGTELPRKASEIKSQDQSEINTAVSVVEGKVSAPEGVKEE